eukprot:gb/GFBE01067977.1/.p1 GENE.gb/GFBE01067977.1/~~gb/GFBE01067977.1/.p1  ORF type:complete len:472 (+),score=70.37 gb/GFBE01067977.1/:1-1416(+)
MELLGKMGSKLQSDVLAKMSSKLQRVTSRQKKEQMPGANAFEELRELAFEYSWAELCDATGSFSAERRLGAGTSGAVFRGTLREGIDVAVKVMEGPVSGGFEEEVRFLSRCRHPNVVMLLGFAQAPREESEGTQQPRRALVYELLHGGDLHSQLHSSRRKEFRWEDRLRALMDVARGLSHLHKHRPEIFHRDIKPANILFGPGGVAKIADFGLACISKCRDERELAVNTTAGTAGYADPLYAKSSVVTEGSEVYSFGMVMIELLTGRMPALVGPTGSLVWLVEEIKPYHQGAKDRLLKMLDPYAVWPRTTATTLANLALLCISQDTDQRPSFLDLANLLQELAAHRPAKDPAVNTDHHPAGAASAAARGDASLHYRPSFLQERACHAVPLAAASPGINYQFPTPQVVPQAQQGFGAHGVYRSHAWQHPVAAAAAASSAAHCGQVAVSPVIVQHLGVQKWHQAMPSLQPQRA